MSSYRRHYDAAVQRGVETFRLTLYVGWYRATHHFNTAAQIAKAANDLPRQLLAEWSGARCSAYNIITMSNTWYAVNDSYRRTVAVADLAAKHPKFRHYGLACKLEILQEWADTLRRREDLFADQIAELQAEARETASLLVAA